MHIVIICVIIVALLGFFFIYQRDKLKKELSKKILSYQEQVNTFFKEFSEMLLKVISEDELNNFINKWQNLYSEISKYPLSKKNTTFSEIGRFRETFKGIRKLILQSNKEIKRKEAISDFIKKTNVFFNELFTLTAKYVSHSEKQNFIEKWKETSIKSANLDIHKEENEFEDIERFKTVYNSLNNYFETSNNQFIKNESLKNDILLSNIDGKSLDIQQRTAVITDEDRILVLAGAGSGKTLTISAKVKYLCEVKHIKPEEILLISFTKKSAQEMTERIHNKLNINVEATTFHKLGLDIIKKSTSERPDVADENALNQFIHNFFENELLNYPELVKTITEYFTYYLEIPKNINEYSSLGELYEEEKNADLETLKSKYDREKYIHDIGIEKAKSYKTLNNEQVKSIEETKIANFLFMNGVNYEYEKQYPYESDDPQKKTYRPDFYLTDYNIYLEHFGISEDYTIPWLSPIEEKKYLDGIQWKRAFHKKNGTELLETYSYYSSKGILLKKLKELLLTYNVELKPRDFTDIFNTVYTSKTNKYFSEFIKLCCTFITLFKSNNYKIEQIHDFKKNYPKQNANIFMQERTNLFLEIIEKLLTEYQKFLSSNNLIDFSDMINNAATLINNGCDIVPYKYVIVDEYQDISKSRFNFLKAIANKSGAKFFCVGDDWQSIYRFAGSDISLFTDFEKYFGYTKILRIEKTYRNSQQLINEASKFILQNPLQLKKELVSDKKLDYPLVFWGFEDDAKNTLQYIINKIVSEFGINSSILLLGRTNYDIEIAKQTGLFRITYLNKKEQLEYIPIPELQISFMSIHKSKGLEADNVILLNFKNEKLGFPNQIADDKILNLVLTNAENFQFAEERRLFYVAITRTKNRIFILTDNTNPSIFFKEFMPSNSVCFVSIKEKINENQTNCPFCKTGYLIKVEHERKNFIGCSNFPRCKYTIHDPTVLSNPRRCPECGGFLIKRKSKNGHWFSGCTNYPYCVYTESLKKKSHFSEH